MEALNKFKKQEEQPKILESFPLYR